MKSRNSILVIICSLAVISMMVPFLQRENDRRDLLDCKENLRTLAVAMENYSSEHDGHYPPELKYLVPNYVESLPRCPASGTISYQMEWGPEAPHNTRAFQDYYFLYCAGENHMVNGLPANYPCYDGGGSYCGR